jgi:secondary thiamine-phosphate synthase enzyme
MVSSTGASRKRVTLTRPRIRAVREFSVRTQRQSQLVEITELVTAAAGNLAGAVAVLVYVPHTTAGVTVNEHADPAVARDFETALERIVSSEWPWEHVEEGEENAPTHIRAAFMGPDVVVPVRDGKLALGTWQGIFFCEFDGPRDRSVYVTTLS